MAKKRWMASVLKTAADTQVSLPWERGPRREASIVRRDTKSAKAKLAGA